MQGNLKQALEYASKNPNSDFANQLGKTIASGQVDSQARQLGIDLTPIKAKFVPQYTKPDLIETGSPYGVVGNALGNFATGVGQGIFSTAKGAGTLVQSGLDATINKIMPKGAELGSDIYRKGTTAEQKATDIVTPQNTAQKIGKFTEQVAEYAVPGSIVTGATKTLSLFPKILSRALTSGTVASIQSGDIGKDAAIAAGIETALPVAGKFIVKPATKLVSGLFKNIGSAMSGVPSETLSKIVNNPESARDTVNIIKNIGQEQVLKNNIQTYIDGVSKIRKEASNAYREGVSNLKTTDIKPDVFRKSVSATLDSFGSLTKNGVRKLTNVEFDNPTMLKKANNLINKLSTTPLDGFSLNKLQNQIEKEAFKTTGGDAQRLSFNAFVRDLSNSVRNAINSSTNKLNEINKAYSKDIGLSEGIQDILGNVQFKNDSEIIAISKKLDNLFNSQKGLSEDYLNKFLSRIGVKPEDFKTSEAVRRISNIEAGANTMGTNKMELVRSLTASIITPKMVRDIAILTGKSERVLKPILENLSPTLRGSLIELLTTNGE